MLNPLNLEILTTYIKNHVSEYDKITDNFNLISSPNSSTNIWNLLHKCKYRFSDTENNCGNCKHIKSMTVSVCSTSQSINSCKLHRICCSKEYVCKDYES